MTTRVAVLGAGAIGGAVAARLARAGCVVSVLARGAHRDAIKQAGLTCESDGETFTAPAQTFDDPGCLPPADIAFLCVKSQDLPSLTRGLHPDFIRDAVIAPIVNGIPWWYAPPGAGESLRAVDPDGELRARFHSARIVGAIAHFSAEVIRPGVVKHTPRGQIVVGDAQRAGEEAQRVAGLLAQAGFAAHHVGDIGREIWLKLIGNVAFNPVSALTGADMAQICANDDLLRVVRQAMSECAAVANSQGVSALVSVDERIAMARRIGAAKLSMLQDLERGRRVESAALMGVVAELGARANVPTPTISMLQALVEERANHLFDRRLS